MLMMSGVRIKPQQEPTHITWRASTESAMFLCVARNQCKPSLVRWCFSLLKVSQARATLPSLFTTQFCILFKVFSTLSFFFFVRWSLSWYTAHHMRVKSYLLCFFRSFWHPFSIVALVHIFSFSYDLQFLIILKTPLYHFFFFCKHLFSYECESLHFCSDTPFGTLHWGHLKKKKTTTLPNSGGCRIEAFSHLSFFLLNLFFFISPSSP